MSIFFTRGLAAAAAAALLLVPAVSMAAYASSEPATAGAAESAAPEWVASVARPIGTVPSQGTLAAGFLAQSVAQVGPSQAVARPEDESDAMKTALSAKPLSIPVFGNLRGNSGLLLWNLCAVVRAQQDRRTFALIDTGIATVFISEDIARVSAVPLPGAVWMFVMGVLGLAGTRVTGIKRSKGAAGANDVDAGWPQHAGAVPA